MEAPKKSPKYRKRIVAYIYKFGTPLAGHIVPKANVELNTGDPPYMVLEFSKEDGPRLLHFAETCARDFDGLTREYFQAVVNSLKFFLNRKDHSKIVYLRCDGGKLEGW